MDSYDDKVEKRREELKIDAEAKYRNALEEKRKKDAMDNLKNTLSENEVRHLLNLYNLPDLNTTIDINYTFSIITIYFEKENAFHQFSFKSPKNDNEAAIVKNDFKQFLKKRKLIQKKGLLSFLFG